VDEAGGWMVGLQRREQVGLSRGIGLGGDACGLAEQDHIAVLVQNLNIHGSLLFFDMGEYKT
jgi:hypothetical protein